MGLFQKPKFKKLNKATGKWETVVPQPEEYNAPGRSLTPIRVGSGATHKHFDLVLLESKMAKR